MRVVDAADGTRYRIIFLLISSVVILSLGVMVLAALGKDVPDIVAGAAIGGLITQMGNSIPAFFKGREEIQSAKIENEKTCASATAALTTAPDVIK